MPSPDIGPPPQNPLRAALTWLALLLALALIGWQGAKLLEDPTVWPPDDFVEYWAAGRLNAQGQNPYDPELLLPLERAAGRDTDEAVMMWNPPWTLPLVMPFGVLPSRPAQLLWLACHLAAVLFSADRLWRLYRGHADRRWVAWALTLTFLPVPFALQSGQISAFLLLGCVGFLVFMEKGKPFLAGASMLLMALKPHLFALVWLAALVWAVRGGRWRFVLGGLCAGVTATLLPMLWNPDVLAQYWEALTQRPPEHFVSPTFGTVLRLAFGEELFRLQFVPVAFGVAWLAWYGWRHRAHWDWCEQLPLLVLASLVVAPYGAWPFDMVLLLLPLVHLAARLSTCGQRWRVALAVAGYACVDAAALTLNLLQIKSFWFIWMSPAVLLLYVLCLPPAPKPAPDTAE